MADYLDGVGATAMPHLDPHEFVRLAAALISTTPRPAEASSSWRDYEKSDQS